MKQTAIVLALLITISGCKTPAGTKTQTQSASLYDSAIENLSMTAEQLESLRKEKDFFVKSLEDFERQKYEYGYLLDVGRLRSQMQDFTEWHRDISKRERILEVQHSLNVLAAHSQVAKRRSPVSTRPSRGGQAPKRTPADTASPAKP
jgi:hypothetical protein